MSYINTRWKDELQSAFRATETQEHWWHLPDSRTVRVVLNPHPKGGLTWVFENLTERIDLESRYTTMVRVQGETLDNLAEGVVVFGSDGVLQLANPKTSTKSASIFTIRIFTHRFFYCSIQVI